MKIVYLIPRFYPSTGGGETYILELAKRMVKKGHRVTVYTTNITEGSKPKKQEEYLGIKIKRYSVSGSKKFYHYMKKLYNDLKKEEADIIHGGGFTFYGCDIAAKICQKRNIPYVLTPFYHPPSTSQGKRKIFRFFYDPLLGRKKLKIVQKIIVMTNQEIEYLSKFTSMKKFVRIPIGINFKALENKKAIEEFKNKFDIKDKDKILLFVGRIKKNKGIQYVIPALRGINKKIKNIKLLLVGPDNGYLRELKKLTNKLNLTKNVIFTGPLTFKDYLSEAYHCCDIFVFPSEYESFGITAAEALACGKPVVGTDIGGTRDIVKNGEYGYLTKYGNVSQLKNNILKLLCDKKLRKNMGQRGKRFVYEHYNWDLIVNKIEKIYQDLT